MVIVVPQSLELEQFLHQAEIEDSPAWAFVGGNRIRKPMPGTKHSRLQSRLAGAINPDLAAYEAFPELRCPLGGGDRSFLIG